MYNESNDSKMSNYADSIYQYLLSNNLTSYDIYDYDDFAEELDNAIQNGEIEDIPELDREDAFKIAVENLDDAVNDYDDSMDGDWDSGMKSAGWGTEEDYGNASDMYEQTLKETNEILHLLNESLASKQAKKLGLVHVGFGNYAEESGAPAQYKTVNGKLKKVKGSAPKKVAKKYDKEEKSKKKEEPKKEKPKQSGIKNLRRISGEKFTYEFEKDGRKYKFTLNKGERKELKGKGSIMDLVKKRLEGKKKRQQSKEFKKGKPENKK